MIVGDAACFPAFASPNFGSSHLLGLNCHVHRQGAGNPSALTWVKAADASGALCEPGPNQAKVALYFQL